MHKHESQNIMHSIWRTCELIYMSYYQILFMQIFCLTFNQRQIFNPQTFQIGTYSIYFQFKIMHLIIKYFKSLRNF